VWWCLHHGIHQDPASPLHDVIAGADIAFTTLFTLEMLLKWLGLGWCKHQYSYFRDPWNWLDFFIVIEGLVSSLFQSTGVNLQGIRMLRVLRPLRTITHLEGVCLGVGWVGRLLTTTDGMCRHARACLGVGWVGRLLTTTDGMCRHARARARVCVCVCVVVVWRALYSRVGGALRQACVWSSTPSCFHCRCLSTRCWCACFTF